MQKLKSKIRFLKAKWINGDCRHFCKLCKYKKNEYMCLLELIYTDKITIERIIKSTTE